MPSINFTGLAKVVTNNGYTYSDLHLDLDNPIQRDLKLDHDTAAIANSITNLFNTIPGQDLLNPTYGLNLLQYVFLPANDVTANLIAQAISRNLSVYEPRVTIKGMDINVNSSEQTITITLSILINSLNKQITIPGTLNSTGYTLLSIQ